MNKVVRIGTRESQLAVWQATLVKEQLAAHHIPSELVYIKSDGDIDLVTPLYALGVQGIFTKALDVALLSNKIDIAVHSMKDVPTQLAKGIAQAAVLKRGSHKDLLVYKHKSFIETLKINEPSFTTHHSQLTIATSSIRRKAQWLHHYPNHTVENLRGNVSTRLKKLQENNWHGAIFAAAGLERINLRPENSVELDWMLPAPAQGAIMVVCREDDDYAKQSCVLLNDEVTAICTKAERDFLKTLMGGCSTPISALAEIKNDMLHFKGNIFSTDGKRKADIAIRIPVTEAAAAGASAAKSLLQNGGKEIMEEIKSAAK